MAKEYALQRQQVHLIIALSRGFDREDILSSLEGEKGRKIWAHLLRLLMLAGLTEEDMQHELGASISTQHRWLTASSMPNREHRSRCIQDALKVLRLKIP